MERDNTRHSEEVAIILGKSPQKSLREWKLYKYDKTMIQKVIDKLPRKDMNIIMGDVNTDWSRQCKIRLFHGTTTWFGTDGRQWRNIRKRPFSTVWVYRGLLSLSRISWVSPDGVTEN